MIINDVKQLQQINNVISETIGFFVLGEKNYYDLLNKTMVGVPKYKIDNHFNGIQKHARELKENMINLAKKNNIKID